MAAGRKSKSYHHGNLKEGLIEAALGIISWNGIEGLSLREVSRLAGASHAAPYRHFRDKSDLLAAVAETGFARLLSKTKRAVKNKPPLKRVEAVVATYLGFATRHTAHFRVMYARELGDRSRYPALQAVEQEVGAFIYEVITACQKVGIMIDRDPEEIAIATWCSCHGAADLYNNGQFPAAISVKQLARIVMESISHGFLKDGKKEKK